MADTTLDLTEGSIPGKILAFAWPVFLGQLFQQLYNVVDSLVVGNFIGSEALAAVGSSGSLIQMLVGLINGLFMGAGVVVSRYVGAKDDTNISAAVHTTLTLGLMIGLAASVFGVALSPTILVWMGTPDSVFADADVYLRLYFSGMLAGVLYNAANGICNAVGDSRHSLYYLIVSSVTNVVLDLLFVAVLHTGVAGAAVATVIAQAFAALLNLVRLHGIAEPWRVELRKLRLYPGMAAQVLRIGLPSGLQNSIISIANVVVQSNINAFGAYAMSGSAAYSKIEGFGFLPITSFSMAMATFIGQSLGAKKYDRARKGARFGVVCGVAMAELVGVVIYLAGPQLIGLFDRAPETIEYGVIRCHIVCPLFCLLALSHCMAGILRGAGKSFVPMTIMAVCWCLIRVTYLLVVVPMAGTIESVYFCYPLTWTLSSIAFIVYYFRADWVHGFDKAA